jgi:hypothetical protein
MISARGCPMFSASSSSARYSPTSFLAWVLAATVCAIPVPIFTAASGGVRICFLDSSCVGLVTSRRCRRGGVLVVARLVVLAPRVAGNRSVAVAPPESPPSPAAAGSPPPPSPPPPAPEEQAARAPRRRERAGGRGEALVEAGCSAAVHSWSPLGPGGGRCCRCRRARARRRWPWPPASRPAPARRAPRGRSRGGAGALPADPAGRRGGLGDVPGLAGSADPDGPALLCGHAGGR